MGDGRPLLRRIVVAGALALATGCARKPEPPAPPPARPTLLLVTLDTTRADALAPEADAAATPGFAALAARGVRFTQAYATAPSTLPSHTSMLTGLAPAGHGIHENGRRLPDGIPVVTERLRGLGYNTAAFVSGYPLERQFGLARGFELYDDELGPGKVERSARETTDRALAWLAAADSRPRFLWVHYYDPHEPYAPPEPFRSRFPADPYQGEIAAMDHELARLLAAFEASPGGAGTRIIVAADHGEGRGDHGETLHGNLLYQGVMRVPLVLAGEGVEPGTRSDPVSLRQIHATLLGWAGEKAEGGLLTPAGGPVLGEAMQPLLNYRWQPQVMAVAGRHKLIRSGRLELYDVVDDPKEERDLAGSVAPARALLTAVAGYPLPGEGGTAPPAATLGDEERRRLASLGYLVSGEAPKAVPDGAPRAADMTALFHELDAGSLAFVEERYALAAKSFEGILARDPGNLMTAVRLAVCQSLLGKDRAALATFELARRIDPASIEVRHYLGMHHLKGGQDELAAPLFESVLKAQPDRVAAIEGLAKIRARQGRMAEAAALLDRSVPLSRDPATRLVEVGLLRMELGETAPAIAALEQARASQGAAFRRSLELGVLYLASRRFAEARTALDRVPPDHPAAAMALFKRAQVSVLLDEPDSRERIRTAWERADPATRRLIAGERLFAGRLP
ncbi:MAG: sulfatase-like hydrolase/transferase [Holophagales bacterium]|nr:sulfatase-like hydrolase/transferase [Holophagales bacterium]